MSGNTEYHESSYKTWECGPKDGWPEGELYTEIWRMGRAVFWVGRQCVCKTLRKKDGTWRNERKVRLATDDGGEKGLGSAELTHPRPGIYRPWVRVLIFAFIHPSYHQIGGTSCQCPSQMTSSSLLFSSPRLPSLCPQAFRRFAPLSLSVRPGLFLCAFARRHLTIVSPLEPSQTLTSAL